MSLITRCPACGTMFKVVTDQLKVSQGWVRCGYCTEVFDGSAHLLPGDIAAPPPLGFASDERPEPGQTLQSQRAQALEAPVEPERDPAEPAWAPARLFADREPMIPVWSGNDDAQGSAADFDPASWKQQHQQNEAETVPDNAPSMDTATGHETGFELSDVADSEAQDAEAAHDVSFVRDARRKAFWRKPLVRWSLGGLSVLLLAVLALQWGVQQKDRLAALEPRLVPLLQTLCGHLRCEIRLPRHVESLVIDSSTFNKIGPAAYRLSFTLKNTGDITLEIPALEVTLTDTQDRALVRRVLAPAQFGASATALAAHSELVGVVTMKISGDDGGGAAPSSPPAPLRVAGYRILAFYP